MLPTFLPSMVPVPNLISSHKIASHRNVIVIVLLVSTCHSFISEAQALEMSWRGKGGESYSTNLLMTKKTPPPDIPAVPGNAPGRDEQQSS